MGKNDLQNKQKAVQAAIDLIEKTYGRGAIMQLGKTKNMTDETDVVSTGIMRLDRALGIGGYPRGRIVEVYGPEASGKTTIALHAIAAAQRAGGVVAFIDAEHALDLKYAKTLGINTTDLLVSQPDHGEQALDITETLIRSSAVDMIVVDSVAALTPQAELEGDITDTNVGLQARLMSKALRKITGCINKSNTIVIFINQLRANISAMGYGPSETTTGGKALKYFSSQRLEVKRIAAVKSGTDVIGHTVRIRISKNKLAAPFKDFTADIIYGFGIEHFAELLDLAVEFGFIKKAGAWFSYNDGKLGQGKENSRLFLKNNPEIASEIEKMIMKEMGLVAPEDVAPVAQRAPVEKK